MGLGGVAIAVLPSVVHLQLTFSDRLGGGIFRVTIVCTYFLTYIKVRRGLAMVSFPSAKLWLGSKKAMV